MQREEQTVLHLQVARTLRSIGQGIAVVDLALYLRALHWSGTAIGGVMTAAGLAGAGLMLLVGVFSDRWGRKTFLLAYEILTALSALLLVLTQNPAVLAAIIVATGLGRGQNGAAGPFTPAEQAWMAHVVPSRGRARVFSVNTALGFFGMALGALLAGVKRTPGPSGYHPLFLLIFVTSVLCVLTIATTPRDLPDPAEASLPSPAHEQVVRREENRNIARLAVVNGINGLAIGFLGPMMSYWFAERFGVSAAAIGVTFAVSFVVTGVSSLLTGGLADRVGMVRTVVWFQMVGFVLMVVMPFLPTFWLASLAYVLRSAFSRGTQGARSALSASITRDGRRGFSLSLNSLVMRFTSAIGPTLVGYLLEAGDFAAPLVLAGVLQLGSALLYGRLFRQFDEPAASSPGASA